ncbi:MLO-like protein 13 [Diospyros lotus]|uniref:MLO-like protein 13 n=1 Tax=Diospyros lotus TaxID=55363 RepID=UPI002250655E|nr:MLO-like protein 13 [Diospyros lotus]XP_052192461.1 MLO-like protein 13 [Diospyros lotus]XP_052192462.1 MLO-like protein 13 [Diospyros lotus]
MAEESRSLEYTPTWVVAVVCCVIVFISLVVERGLHRLGKFLKQHNQDALFEALQKLKEELMLLGFISLLLTVSQGLISHMCIPIDLASHMLPCELKTAAHGPGNEHELYFQHTTTHGRRLLAGSTGSDHCSRKGKIPLLSLEALHHLHIFIFVLAVVHMFFCATTMVLGGARIRQWKFWEDSIRREITETHTAHTRSHVRHHHLFIQRTYGHWRKYAVVSWMMSFFKQFYNSISKSDYIALRTGFIKAHCPSMPEFDFHEYMLRTLEIDFKTVVSISWYLWLFVVVFLLINIEGWHAYFWMSFLPLVLLLLVGAKLEVVIMRLAEDFAEEIKQNDHEAQSVHPSDKYFWFQKPQLVLYLIHFILFQNSFELAFLFWILTTYGFHSCIMEKLGFLIPRLIVGVIVQVLCSYSTLPLYAIVTQMGSGFKEGFFKEHFRELFHLWVGEGRGGRAENHSSQTVRMEDDRIIEQTALDQVTTASVIELSCPKQTQTSSP